jgi:hypothetical protein
VSLAVFGSSFQLTLFLPGLAVPPGCPPFVLVGLLSFPFRNQFLQCRYRGPLIDGNSKRSYYLLDDMTFMLRRGPAGSDSDNVACPEGGVRVVNEVVLRVGEPL